MTFPPHLRSLHSRPPIPGVPFEPWMYGSPPAQLWGGSLIEEQQRRVYAVFLSALRLDVTTDTLRECFGKALDFSKANLIVERVEDRSFQYRRARLGGLTWNEFEACLDLRAQLAGIDIQIYPDPENEFQPSKLPDVIPKGITHTSLPIELLTNLYVENIPSEWNNFQLREVFSALGPVAHAEIMNNPKLRYGRSLRWAFVDMASYAGAVRAVEALNGMRWHEGALEVRLAEKQRKLSFEILKSGCVVPPHVARHIRQHAHSSEIERTVVLDELRPELCCNEETVLHFFSEFGLIRRCKLDPTDPAEAHVSSSSASRCVTLVFEHRLSADSLLSTRGKTDLYIPRGIDPFLQRSRDSKQISNARVTVVPDLNKFSCLAPGTYGPYHHVANSAHAPPAPSLVKHLPPSSAFWAPPPSQSLKVDIRPPAERSTFDPFAEDDLAGRIKSLNLGNEKSASSRGSSDDNISYASRIQPVTPSSNVNVTYRYPASREGSLKMYGTSVVEEQTPIQLLNAASSLFKPELPQASHESSVKSISSPLEPTTFPHHSTGGLERHFSRAPARPTIPKRMSPENHSAKSIEALQRTRGQWEGSSRFYPTCQ